MQAALHVCSLFFVFALLRIRPSDMASKCLVEFREKKIVVNFDESLTRQELLANLQASGVLPNVDSAQLKFTVSAYVIFFSL